MRRKPRLEQNGFRKRVAFLHRRSLYGKDAGKKKAKSRETAGSRQKAAPERLFARMDESRNRRSLHALRPRQSRAQGRACPRRPLHPSRGGGALGAGDRCRRQQGDAGAVRRRRHARKDGGARRGEGARLRQDDRALSRQSEKHHRAVGKAHRRTWRKGSGHPRGFGEPAGRRPQDRECRAQHRLRRADDRGRHASLSRRQPHRAWHPARIRWKWSWACLRACPSGSSAMRTIGSSCTGAMCARRARPNARAA